MLPVIQGSKFQGGGYITFVDSDDTVEPSMYESMLKALLESNADICVCQFKLRDNFDETPRSIMDKSYSGVYGNSYSMIYILYDSTPARYKDTLVQSVWNKLYRKELFRTVSFDGKFGEDCFVNNRIFASQCEICIIGDEFYNYYYTANAKSLSHSITAAQRLIFLDILSDRVELYDDEYIRSESMIRFCDLYTAFLTASEDIKNKLVGYSSKFKDYLTKLKKKNVQGISIKKKLRWKIAENSPSLYRRLAAIRGKIRS